MYIYNQELIKILVFDFEFIFLNYIYFREIIRIIYFFNNNLIILIKFYFNTYIFKE